MKTFVGFAPKTMKVFLLALEAFVKALVKEKK
jgi:hypothetical protein